MQLTILHKTNDDKGTQLELLTSRILKSIGYTDIIMNLVSTGGHEIDIIASYSQPGMGQPITRMTIGECKAKGTPIDTNDWLKFLGKIFTEELGGKNNIDGCMIALSGANGNVKGQYMHLKETRNNIQLIEGDGLINSLNKIYNIVDISIVNREISKLSERIATNISLCYYADKIYFLVNFEAGAFTIMSHDGKATTNIDEIKSLVVANTESEIFIDLEKEQYNLNRQFHIEKYVFAILFKNDNALTWTEIKSIYDESFDKDVQFKNIEQQEIEFSIEQLNNKNLVLTENGKSFPEIKSRIPDQESLIQTYRYFFKDFLVLQAFVSISFQRYISMEMLNAVCTTQGGLFLNQEEKNKALEIISWSPSALAYSIHPDPMLTNHRRLDVANHEDIDLLDASYYMQKITTHLIGDFKRQEFHEYFFKKRNIVEIESNQTMRIKSNKAVLSEIAFKERLVLGETDETLGSTLVLMRAINNGEEPWELMNSNESEAI